MVATVEVRPPGPSHPDALRVTVPLSAVSSDGSDRYVWVVDEDTMQVSKRAVSVTDGVGETVLVTDGLEGNETIAVAGASFLGEGMTVRPWVE